MTALLAKATALALVKHPVVNSSCRDGKSFTYNSSINIAVAVAIDGGLITPVLQDADKVLVNLLLALLLVFSGCELFFNYKLCIFQADIYSLSRKWKELVDKARAKQLQPHEYNTGMASTCLCFCLISWSYSHMVLFPPLYCYAASHCSSGAQFALVSSHDYQLTEYVVIYAMQFANSKYWLLP